jgi:hypothetical protein
MADANLPKNGGCQFTQKWRMPIYPKMADANLPKKAKKRPNDRIILFLENCFKKGQMATLFMRVTG